MKLTLDTDYTTEGQRRSLARFLSGTIEGEPRGFEPYMPNDGDHSFWCLDSANNWKLKFGDYPQVFEVWYRYAQGNPEYEAGLLAWLKVRLGVEVVS